MSHISENEIIQACRTLFGPDIALSREFLDYLQPSGAKLAYRQKVKETHPDSFVDQDSQRQQEQTSLFQELLAAYETVSDFFKQRESGLWVAREEPRPRRQQPQPAPHRTWERSAEDGFGHSTKTSTKTGTLPLRPLEFGLFLYHQGIITYRQLIDALIWQRRQRPNLGDIAQRWGWLTQEDVRSILSYRGIFGRFGEKAVNLELLTKQQLNTLLFFQRSQQKKLGLFFVEHRIITVEDMENLVLEQKNHNARAALERFRRRR